MCLLCCVQRFSSLNAHSCNFLNMVTNYVNVLFVISGDVPLVEFIYLVFTRMPCESYVDDSGLCSCTCVTYFER